MNEQDSISIAIAALDAVIISCRKQQISLGKVLAKKMNVPEEELLKVLRLTSQDLLNKNNLGY
jgi:hypothetical protein